MLKRILIAVTVIVVCGISLLYIAPEKWLRNFAGRKASAELGREFSIDGPIHIDWHLSAPYIHLNKLRLANSPGSDKPNMMSIDQMNFHIRIWRLLLGELNIPDIELVKPQIVLEKKSATSKNWDFPTLSKAKALSHAVLPTQRSNVPLIGSLTIQDAVLEYNDVPDALNIALNIDSAKGSGININENGSFTLKGKGTLQNQDFAIQATGGSLSMLRNTDSAYPLDLRITMGKTVVDIKGTFTDPVKMADLDANLDLRGSSFSDLFYLTAIPLPPSPPYHLSGHLKKRGEQWDFENFKGLVGQSDLSGNLSYDTSNTRGFTKAVLTSQNLRVVDLSGLIGVNQGDAESTPKKDNDRVLPDVPINLGRLRASDIDIDLKAAKIEQPGFPLDNLDMHFILKNGILKIDPFSFGIADGTVYGPIILNGITDEPTVSFDLFLHRLSLKPFFSDTQFAEFSSGQFGGKLQIVGHGYSLANILGTGNGRVTLIMTGGTLSKLIVDAAGLDFGKATIALLGKDEKTTIRCAIADFALDNGVLNSKIFVIDTSASNIEGKAAINMKNETLDASIKAHPKEVSLTARTPITITGAFRHPSIGLDPKEISERGLAAAALSLLTPLAAVIPFIEPGLGKDSDCQHFIDDASAHSGTKPPPATQTQ